VERERRVPVGLVNALRPYFSEAGLHLFKWKRKILFASAIRPQRHPAGQTFSEGISAILSAVGEKPGIKRPELAQKVLGALPADDPQATARKEALASDLHYLVHIGYVVEFQNGTLELPPAKKEANAPAADEHRMDVAAEMAELHDAPESRGTQTPAKPDPSRPAEAAPVEQRERSVVAESSSAEVAYAATSSPAAQSGSPDPGYLLLPLATAAFSAAI
jgi:hypothetical protein